MKKITLLYRYLLFFIFLFISTNAYSQTIPPPDTDCSSSDLILVGATLTGGDLCVDCSLATTITKTLTLAIDNKTGSQRTSFAFWGNLEIYSGLTGLLIHEEVITGCNGPIPPDSITEVDFIDIEYNCGDILEIKDLWLAWTDASPGSTCPLDPNDIHPKCGTVDSIRINAGVNGTFILTDSQCNEPNGAIDLSPTGGITPYTYIWTTIDGVIPTGQENNEDLTSLIAGTYSVEITDGDGCKITKERTINTTFPPTASATKDNDVSCFGGSDGKLTVTSSGGTGVLSYSIDEGLNYQLSNVFTGLGPGTFTIRVKDSNNCIQDSNNVIISQPDFALAASITAQTNVDCFGNSTGSATVTATDGTAPYTYLWSDGQTTATASGLVAGSYTVTVTDANLCTVVNIPVTITQPLGGLAASITAQTNVDCFGNSIGSATVTATDGTAPYSYLWSDGQTTATASGLVAGSYTVTVTDVNLCTVVDIPVTITQPLDGLAASITAQTNVDCFGNITGSATVTATDGTAPYTYLWSDGQTTATALGLVAGSYTVTVTDANLCTVVNIPVTITQPLGGLAASITAQTNVDCFGNSIGSATVTATDGTAPYTYLWSDGQTTATASGLVAGSYTVTVTDVNLCTVVNIPVTITQPLGGLAASITAQTNVDCFGNSTGSATVTATDGKAPYTYLWSDGQTTATASGLVAGSYTVTVTDANLCTVVNIPVTITQPLVALAASITAQTNVDCFGNSTGSATVTATDGTAPYTYLWSDGQTTATASGLVAGSYTVTVTDANLCTVVNIPVTITQPLVALAASITAQTNADCFGNSTGSATVTATDGTAPYTYLWSDGQTTATASGLVAGSYTVTVTDVNLCTVVNIPVTITQPLGGLAASITAQTNADCFGNSTGSATVTATDGTAPYTYLWSDGQTKATALGLVAGSYTVTVTDANLCTVVNIPVTITQPLGGLAASITAQTNVDCFGNSTGSATVTATDGTAPYTYLWSDGQTTATASGLVAGSYTVTVTDVNLCTVVNIPVTITQPLGGLAASITAQTNVDCFGNSTGSATVTATDGTAPYTYLWSDGQTTATVSGLVAGSYTVTVTDANLCTVVNIPVTITQPLVALAASITAQTNADCFGNSTGSATVTATDGTAPYTYLWSDGQTTATASGLVAGSYTVTVTDANLCTVVNIPVTITQPLGGLAASITAQTNVDCFGNSTGSATVTATDGTAPYTYLWSDGQTTATALGLVAGSYTVTVTDANLCTVVNISVTITQPDILTTSIGGVTAASCNGAADGSATVIANGGTVPYTYLWSDGQNTSTAFFTTGSYNVVVTDANGCTSVSGVNIVFKPSPIGVGTTRNLTCESQSININLQTLITNGIPANFFWTVSNNPNVDGEVSGSGDILSAILLNRSNTTQQVVYFVTPFTEGSVSGNCTGSRFTVTVSVPVCKSLFINKIADLTSVSAAGDEITYTITVTNTGNANLTNVLVSDEIVSLGLPSGDSNNNNILEYNEVWIYTGLYTVLQSDLDSYGIDENGNADGDGDIDNTASVVTSEFTVPISASEEVPIIFNPDGDPVFAITNDADLAAVSMAGEVITYATTVENIGDFAINNVVVTDPLATDIAYVSGDDGDGIMQVGEIWTYTSTYTVTQSDLDNNGIDNLGTVDGDGDIDNTVSANGLDPAGDPVPEASADELVPIDFNPNGEPVFAITNDADLVAVSMVGEVITYTTTVENIGDFAINNVVVTDPLATDIAYVSGDDGDGTMQVGEIWTYTSTYTVTQSDLDNNGIDNLGAVDGDGDIDNTVSANGLDPAGDPVPEASADELVPIDFNPNGDPVFAITNDADLAAVSMAGEVITYTTTVENIGDFAINNVVVTDPLATDIAYVSGDDGDGIMQVGEIWTYTSTYTVTQSDLDNNGIDNLGAVDGDGDIDNTVSANGLDPAGDPVPEASVDEEVPIDFTGVDAVFLVINDADLESVSTAGEVITYTVTVENIGEFAINNVVVTDPLATDIAYVSGDDGDGIMQVGEIWTYTSTYTVTQADIDNNGIDSLGAVDNDGDIDNTVTANGLDPGGDPVPEASGSEQVVLDYSNNGEPFYSVIKTADLEEISAVGNIINYTVTVANTATFAISSIEVIDLLVGLTLISGDDNSNDRLDLDEIWTYQGSYTVTEQAIAGYGVDSTGTVDNDGDVDNTASVTGTDPSGTVLGPISDSIFVIIHIPPIAEDDLAETEANIPVDIDILANDSDADGTIDPNSVSIVNPPENGTVVINSDGSVTYTPSVDFIGDDFFTYQVCDNHGLCDTAEVTVITAGVLAAELVIPEGFSPNGDGVHELFDVEGLANLYPDFKMVIYNRWGVLVYDYRHNGNPATEPLWWDGYSEGRMTMGSKPVPVGTYFYTLYFNKDNAKSRAGWLYLNR